MCTGLCLRHGPTIFWLLFIVLATLGVMFEKTWFYAFGEGSKYVPYTGPSLIVSRACAAGLKLHMALVLLFVLRNCMSWLRGTWVHAFFPFDSTIRFHKLIAWVIAFLSTIHTVAHCVTFYNLSYRAPKADLVRLGIIQNNTAPMTPLLYAFTTLPGLTGIIASVFMILMFSTAVASVRRPHFEVFWYTHHFFIIVYVATILHGVASVFGEFPYFFVWVSVSLILYFIERIVRLRRGFKESILTKVIQHPSRVIECRMAQPKFQYKGGEYVFLCCPYLSKLEWHPFSISSSPNEKELSVHIRVCGDWTSKLYNLLNPDKAIGLVQENVALDPDGNPIMLIDGPYGSPAEAAFRYKIVQLWAGGIGVTPFASILKEIKYRIENDKNCKMKQIEFYWVNQDIHAFEWFISLLDDLSKSCPFLEIGLFFTRTGLLPDRSSSLSCQVTELLKQNRLLTKVKFVSHQQTKKILTSSTGETSQLHKVLDEGDEEIDAGGGGGEHDDFSQRSSLLQKISFGRPDVMQIFKEKSQQYQGKVVAVFYCGPPTLGGVIKSACLKFSNDKDKTQFLYHKENF